MSSLGLPLGLGLGIPLLLILSTLALCLCLKCCPLYFGKIPQRRFWNREEDSHQQYRSQYVRDSAQNSIEMSEIPVQDYRRQYIRDNSWSATRSFSREESFLYISRTPSEFGLSTTTLVSSLSNSVLPSVDVHIKMANAPRPSYLSSSGSILIRTYIDQENKKTYI
ncbi:unnamed protein product [Adineta steineri]|uniref:Uncharacterized protein n=1 Tax=Adineta steineri TaxID=433720 RepID=A0A815D8U6_9BILA|nr:unnamed protein product [Adineta steineri]CAF1383041.1 unnamed protein product [Adineta steineri]CAF3687959.1 unnamed protein product [Adineta steineri]CAF3857445.1 unnamed protein product [Adineta steineri]